MILGRVNKLDDEGVINLGHDLAFTAYTLGLVVLNELSFDLNLESKGFPSLIIGSEPHLSKRSGTKERVPFQLHNINRSIKHVHPPGLLVAHAAEVQNDTVNVSQGELPKYAVLQYFNGFSALFHPSLSSKFLVFVGHKRVLCKEGARLENPTFPIIRVSFQRSRSNQEKRGGINVVALGQDLPLRWILDLIDQRAHQLDFKVFNVGIGKEGHAAEQPTIVRPGNHLRQRSKHLLKHLPRQCQRNRILGGLGIRLPWLILHNRLLAKVIPGPQYLDATFSMLVLHFTLPNNIKNAPLASTFEDLIPRIVINCCERISNPMDELIVQIAQEGDLLQHVLCLIVILDSMCRQQFTESHLIHTPQSCLAIHSHTSGSTGGIVKQRQFPKRIPRHGSPNLVPIHDKRHLTAAQNIKMPTSLTLLDDRLALLHLVILKGIHQRFQFAFVQRIKDKVIGQCIQ
mmetsp:Transcript_25829/g.55573  ORF Transcript_25829/g.55573 Transcript_25829/m.55573 type:complete len:457 (-) Transcript_25829:822-2192(-)